MAKQKTPMYTLGHSTHGLNTPLLCVIPLLRLGLLDASTSVGEFSGSGTLTLPQEMSDGLRKATNVRCI